MSFVCSSEIFFELAVPDTEDIQLTQKVSCLGAVFEYRLFKGFLADNERSYMQKARKISRRLCFIMSCSTSIGKETFPCITYHYIRPERANVSSADKTCYSRTFEQVVQVTQCRADHPIIILGGCYRI